MRSRSAQLSKSNLMASRQCLRRVYLERNRPELAVVSRATETAFETGRVVGEIARTVYGDELAVQVPHEGGLEHALARTRRLVNAAHPGPIFEATFRYAGVLVRIDALLPDERGWRLVEVKASTRVEPPHLDDCAIQLWVAAGAGCRISAVRLAHVDSAFVYPGNGDYRGLLAEQDVVDEARGLLPSVPGWIREAQVAVSGPEPEVAVGGHCFKPWACPFIAHCWPQGVDHPLFELPRAARGKLGEFVARGYRDLRDVPPELLSDAQRRVQRITRSGKAETDPSIIDYLRQLAYPRYYLDFESVGPAVPVFAGTRPYQALPFQWSCHFEPAPGRLEHAEFLDLTGTPPFRRLAESLVRALGRSGPVLVYSAYERTMLERLAALFPDLGPALTAQAGRLVDLRPLFEQGYYHPAMRGSWSLKALLPAVLPDMRYDKLEEIQEGTEASSGYLEAVAATTTAERRAALERALRRYCRFDTEALYRLVEHFSAPRP